MSDVLDETFISMHPTVAPSWAGFWSLDDHRGGPPERLTPDHANNPQEVLAALALRCAVTAVPVAVARAISSLPAGPVAIPLPDAAPSVITLCGHAHRQNPHVEALRAYAMTGA